MAIHNKETDSIEDVIIKLNSEYIIPGTNIRIEIGEFLPDFMMSGNNFISKSNEPKNPAVRVSIFENDRQIYKGWMYAKYPSIKPFQHSKYSIIFKEGILQTSQTEETQETKETPKTRKYTVQAGVFKDAYVADALKAKLDKKGYKTYIIPSETKRHEKLYKVMVGEFITRKEAEVLSIQIKNAESLRTFVTFKTDKEELR
jgi:hypothetical protein